MLPIVARMQREQRCCQFCVSTGAVVRGRAQAAAALDRSARCVDAAHMGVHDLPESGPQKKGEGVEETVELGDPPPPHHVSHCVDHADTQDDAEAIEAVEELVLDRLQDHPQRLLVDLPQSAGGRNCVRHLAEEVDAEEKLGREAVAKVLQDAPQDGFERKLVALRSRHVDEDRRGLNLQENRVALPEHERVGPLAQVHLGAENGSHGLLFHDDGIVTIRDVELMALQRLQIGTEQRAHDLAHRVHVGRAHFLRDLRRVSLEEVVQRRIAQQLLLLDHVHVRPGLSEPRDRLQQVVPRPGNRSGTQLREVRADFLRDGCPCGGDAHRGAVFRRLPLPDIGDLVV
mmetsp:Transcript_15534/g.59043  ORF Transcript_15534/g.59043 Transcript_15534/m.59043 type:complete len:344 (+) Transcript_15534:922-1953(+)